MGDRQAVLDGLLGGAAGARWSVCLLDGDTTLAAHDESVGLATASVGKLILLIEIARRAERDPTFLDVRLARATGSPVADSGIWQHLHVDPLDVHDLAVLVASTSDNLATNVLLAHVGLDAVAACAVDLGLHTTALLDVVRDARDETMPPDLSVGCAQELAGLMARTAGGRLLSPAVSQRLAGWLALDTDLSLVASAFGLDPLAHGDGDHAHRGLHVGNKTGMNDRVRADVGLVRGPRGELAYAVLANFAPGDPDVLDAVLDVMRGIGRLVRTEVTDPRHRLGTDRRAGRSNRP